MQVKIISTKELQKLIADKASYVLIDVREKNELVHGVIPTSKNVPLSDFGSVLNMSEKDFEKKYKFPKFKKSDKIIVYCRSGGRSGHASEILHQAGYTATNYAGSILEWSKIDKNVKAY